MVKTLTDATVPDIASVDNAKAYRYYKMACEKSHSFSCLRMAGLIVTGEGVRKDVRRAQKLARKWCPHFKKNEDVYKKQGFITTFTRRNMCREDD